MVSRIGVCAEKLVPKAVKRQKESEVEESPFGLAFHGPLDHKGAEELLHQAEGGNFLIRRSGSSTDHYTLSIRFGDRIKHFKLYYEQDSGMVFLKQQYKHLTIEDLVEDGLLNYQLEQIHGKVKNPEKRNGDKNKKNLLVKPKNTIEEKDTTKKHVFKHHTFRGLNWCEVCAQFLWGFSVHGMKCENCSFVAHKRCAETEIKQDCPMNKNEFKGPLFGVELVEITKRLSNSIPFIVVKCVEEIEARGIFVEGIYRVSGFADEVDDLKNSFEKLGPQTQVSAEHLNIHTVAGVLKLYFRSLPTPLITGECSSLLLANLDIEDPGKQLQSIKTNLLRLSTPHWNGLKYIVNHLRRVGTYHEQNKMNNSNLATVFAPTLIGTNLNQFTDLSREIFLLTYIISNCTILFA